MEDLETIMNDYDSQVKKINEGRRNDVVQFIRDGLTLLVESGYQKRIVLSERGFVTGPGTRYILKDGKILGYYPGKKLGPIDFTKPREVSPAEVPFEKYSFAIELYPLAQELDKVIKEQKKKAESPVYASK
jgi:hypothetical protein